MMNSTNPDIEAFTDHDQLPTVDEAKLQANVGNAPRRKCVAKQCFWIVVIVVAAALVISAVSWLAVSESDSSVAPENDVIIPPNNNVIQSKPMPMPEPSQDPEPSQEPMPVPVPSEQPVIDPELEKFLDILTNISSYEDLIRSESPQNKALRWASADNLTQSHLENDRFEELFQRYIFAVFFYAMGGENWNYDLNFLSAKDVCQWFEMTLGGSSQISMRSSYFGIWCPADSTMAGELRFPARYLNGTLPSELQRLTKLQVIDFAYNPGIAGGFPTFVQSLPHLVYLGLHYNDLEGILPDWLDAMTSLETLVLSNNKFTGTVPSSLSRLTNLEYLYLDDNNLFGDISLFAPLTNLSHLMLEDNMFQGSIDEEWVEQMSSLSILDASNNQIDSTLPSNFWSGLSKLKVLDLHSNSISGTIPYADSPHPLEFLAVSDNNLGGEIPTAMKEFKSLRHLDLGYNHFESFVPGGLGSLIQLEYLFLSGNPVENGDLPMFLMSLTNLVDLSLKECNLQGTIPLWLGSLNNLVLLDLAENELTGEVPTQIGQMQSLKHLLLQRNELQGTLPRSLDENDGLETLLVDHNNIVSQTVCESVFKPKIFVTDCNVPCDCCTLCCESGDEDCNRNDWLGEIDPIWEYGFKRGSDDYGFFETP